MSQRSVLHAPPLTDFHGLLTTAPEMLELFRKVERVARTNAAVLIRGETGTGKELVAQAIHRLSPRADKPFRAVNCATFTPELLSSELFGHVKGAFTGAVENRPGLFKAAHGGTVFLDEVAEIPLNLQAQLLRVLQDQTFVPVGGSKPVTVDVRIVSATHRALRHEVEAGRFREDLKYRIRVVPLYLPPLRDRAGDLEALTRHFILERNRQEFRRVESIDSAALDAMSAYPWPGNVRELRNVIEYAFAVGEGPTLSLQDLTPELRGEMPEEAPSVEPTSLEDQERRRILSALQETGGKKAEAAEVLRMSRSTLWRKLREHGLS
ncbi:MAG: sigma 54-interacting transcriptional regulator [Myxococcota bacterium]